MSALSRLRWQFRSWHPSDAAWNQPATQEWCRIVCDQSTQRRRTLYHIIGLLKRLPAASGCSQISFGYGLQKARAFGQKLPRCMGFTSDRHTGGGRRLLLALAVQLAGLLVLGRTEDAVGVQAVRARLLPVELRGRAVGATPPAPLRWAAHLQTKVRTYGTKDKTISVCSNSSRAVSPTDASNPSPAVGQVAILSEFNNFGVCTVFSGRPCTLQTCLGAEHTISGCGASARSNGSTGLVTMRCHHDHWPPSCVKREALSALRLHRTCGGGLAGNAAALRAPVARTAAAT